MGVMIVRLHLGVWSVRATAANSPFAVISDLSFTSLSMRPAISMFENGYTRISDLFEVEYLGCEGSMRGSEGFGSKGSCTRVHIPSVPGKSCPLSELAVGERGTVL